MTVKIIRTNIDFTQELETNNVSPFLNIFLINNDNNDNNKLE